MPQLSVIIPTFQRETVLQDTLRQLSQQHTLPDEIIIIDQGSERDVQAIVTIPQKHGIKCSCVFSKYRSPGSSRNIGIGIAANPLVLFIDDDIELVTDIVGIHSRYYEEEPDLGGVAGHILPKHDYGGLYAIWNTFTPTGRYVEEGRTGNMSFRLDALRRIGGFNAFLRYTAEEGELCHRILKAGYKIRNGEEAVVKHLSSPGGTRAWDNFAAALDIARDNITSLASRKSPYLAAFWPLKNWRSSWKTLRAAPSLYSGMKAFLGHYFLGLRYGIRARSIRDYLPLSLLLSQGLGLDKNTGLPSLREIGKGPWISPHDRHQQTIEG